MAQNVAISVFLTEILVRFMYSDMHGWRLLIVIVAAFVFFFRTLDDITDEIIRRGRHDQKNAKGAGSAVSCIPWTENRFSMDSKKDRNPGRHVKAL